MVLNDRQDGCYPGECGFHFPGTRIPHDGNIDSLLTFEVLSGSPADYIWQPVTDAFEVSKFDDLNPVLGGHQSPGGEGDLRLLYIARSLTVDGRVHLGHVSIGKNASICYDGDVMMAKYYEVLVHRNSNPNAVRALVEHTGWQCGVFKSQDAKPSDELEMSSEHRITFTKPFEDGPPMVLVCFSGLDVTGKWNVRVYATNVDPAGFTIAIVS
ncbi:hypothetical protein EST38_g14580, partial [Candolleomyces aberdarensis]